MIRIPSPTEFMQENFIDVNNPLHEERRACKKVFQGLQENCKPLLEKRKNGKPLTEQERITLRKFEILDRFIRQPID